MVKSIFNSFGGGKPSYVRSIDLLLSNIVFFIPALLYLVVSIVVPVVFGIPSLFVPALSLVTALIVGIVLGIALAVTLLITQSMVSSSLQGMSPSLERSFNSAISGGKASGVIVAIVLADIIDYILNFAGAGGLGSLIFVIVIILVIPSLSVSGSFEVVLSGGYDTLRSMFSRDPLTGLLLIVSSALIVVPILNVFFIPYSVILANLSR